MARGGITEPANEIQITPRGLLVLLYLWALYQGRGNLMGRLLCANADVIDSGGGGRADFIICRKMGVIDCQALTTY